MRDDPKVRIPGVEMFTNELESIEQDAKADFSFEYTEFDFDLQDR